MKIRSLFLWTALPLAAQAPTGWNARPWLGQDLPPDSSWFGAGLWAGDVHGPAATLVDSLGLGNALRGGGVKVELGWKRGSWNIAAEALGVRDLDGASYLTLQQGHLTWRGKSGWTWSLEQEPMVWGYGLNGGYLLGESARPFPRFRVETPMKALSLFQVPLGTWGAQVFVGRLENHRVLSDSVQDPTYRRTLLQKGDPQAPLMNGYRLQARFGKNIEFYLNYLNLWSGTLNGRGLTEGYDLKTYLTAMFGAKDALIESNFDPHDPNPMPQGAHKNNARSASNIDTGLRIRIRGLEGALDAETVHAYISRGSKNTYWAPGHMRHQPLYWMGKDLEREGRWLLQGRVANLWNNGSRYTVPNLAEPNDAFGLLIAWPQFRLGLEYADFVNTDRLGIRPFVHDVFVTGFYRYGDPLGNAIAGEADTYTARLEWEPTNRLSSTTWLHAGHQAFRDNPATWNDTFPGHLAVNDHFLGLQQTLRWRVDDATTLSLGASWRRHAAVSFVQGQEGNGFRWFTELGFRWPSRNARMGLASDTAERSREGGRVPISLRDDVRSHEPPLDLSATDDEGASTLTPPDAPPPALDAPTQLPRLAWEDTRFIFTGPGRWSSREWAFAGAGLAAVALAYSVDGRVDEAFARNQSPGRERAAKGIETLGGTGGWVLIGGAYALGHWNDNSELRSWAADAGIAVGIVRGLAVLPMKAIVGRARPDEGLGPHHFKPFGSDSFPSGHTAQAFALASVLAIHADQPWVSALSYGVAGLVGVARLERRGHYLSDVVTGGLLGTVIGQTVARHNLELRASRKVKVSFIPILDPDQRGLAMALKF